MQLEPRLMVGLAMLVLMPLVGGVFAFRAVDAMHDANTEVQRARDTERDLEALLGAHYEQESANRGYVITGADALLAGYAPARATVDRLLAALRERARAQPDRQRIDELATLVTSKRAQMDRTLASFRRGDVAAVQRELQDQGYPLMRTLRDHIDRLVAIERASLRASLADAAQSATVARWIAGAVLVLLVALGITLHAFVRAELRARRHTNALLGERLQAQQEAERKLADHAAELQAIFENMNEGVVVADPTGAMTHFNPAARRIIGVGPTTQAPSTWQRAYGAFHVDQTTPYRESEFPLVRALAGEDILGEQQFLRNADVPEGVFVEVNASAIRAADGRCLGAVAAFRDVTLQLRHSQALRALTAKLERSNRDLQEFATIASHDLQEPLRKIQSFADRLHEDCAGQLDARGQDYLARMRAAAKRGQALVQGMLTYSRVNTKGRPFVPVDLGSCARDALADLDAVIAATAAVVDIGPLPTVEADPTQLRQLFQNLVGNALKFRTPGVAPHVAITADVDGEARCTVRVADNGIGFERTYAERIFGMFQRLHERTAYEGAGVGLALCRKIVERHGGTICADATPGHGAVFTMCLPIQQAVEDMGRAA